MTSRDDSHQEQSRADYQTQRLNQRFGSWVTQLFVLLFFAGVSIAITYPLVLNMRSAVPGPPWDNCVWLYDLWWFRHSIIDLGEWPVFNNMIFQPVGYDLRLSETMLANKLLIAPALFWGDEVLAYNVFLLLSFVLTGYATYLLIAYLTSNRYAALIGGTIFAFCPFRMHAMAAGWLPLLATYWIPLTFLCLERVLHEHRTRFAVGAGVCLGLTFLSSWYYVYIVGSFVVLWVMLRSRPWKETWKQFRLGRDMVTVVLVAGVMVVPVAYPVVLRALGIGEHSAAMGWSLTEVEKWAASLEDFILPNVYHPVWGERFLEMRAYTLRYPWYAPGFVYLGAIALLLALKSRSVGALRSLKKASFWLAFASFFLALGVVAHWNNEVLEIKVPPRAELLVERVMSTIMTKWALHPASYYDISFSTGTIPLPLPGLLIYLFLPLGNSIRTMYRFGVMTVFFVSMLAGLGAAEMLGGVRSPEIVTVPQSRYDFDVVPSFSSGVKQAKRRSAWMVATGCIALLLLVLIDFWVAPLPFGLTDIRPQPLDRWLASQSDDTLVMQFPLVRAFSGDSLYRTKFHGKKVAYGHGTFYPDTFQYAMPVLGTFPSDESLELLSSWGVTHVVVGSGAYDAGWGDQPDQTWVDVRDGIEASGRLEFVGIAYDEDIWRDETVSQIIYGSPPVEPVLVDKVHVYELR